MIKVTKKFLDIPKGLTSKSAIKKQQELMAEGNAHDFSAYYYGHKKTVRKILEDDVYHNKCAYCEGQSEGFTLRVEHYRPKNKLQEDILHSGYYWLAYEWSNLLLACEKCNGTKSNQFPITGVRVNHPQFDKQQWRVNSTSFLNEQVLLLNPELDQPEHHFDFQPDGTLLFITPRGEETIRLCNLNRESLKLARKKVLDEAISNLLDQLDIFFEQKDEGKLDTQEQYNGAIKLGFKNSILGLKNASLSECEYSAFSNCIFQHFELFICQPITDKFTKEFSDVLIDAYHQFVTLSPS